MTKEEFQKIKEQLLRGEPIQGETLEEILVSLGKMGKNVEALRMIMEKDPTLFYEIVKRVSKKTIKNLGEAALTLAALRRDI
jgi:hypothetical protein